MLFEMALWKYNIGVNNKDGILCFIILTGSENLLQEGILFLLNVLLILKIFGSSTLVLKRGRLGLLYYRLGIFAFSEITKFLPGALIPEE